MSKADKNYHTPEYCASRILGEVRSIERRMRDRGGHPVIDMYSYWRAEAAHKGYILGVVPRYWKSRYMWSVTEEGKKFLEANKDKP